MTAQNDFLPVANGASANVLTQSSFAALVASGLGFQSGIASSAAFNKVFRQASVMAAAIAQLVVDQTGQAVVDDGSVANLEAKILAALRVIVHNTNDYYPDTGSVANAYVITGWTPAPVLSAPVTFRFRTTRANTGAATIDFGAGPVALNTEQGNALAAGDLVSGAVTTVVYDPAVGNAIVTESVLSQFGTLAKENIGQGLEDDGAGNLRVKLADSSVRRSVAGVQTAVPLSTVAGNVVLTTTHQGTALLMTGAAPTITAPLSPTLWNGYSVLVNAFGGPVAFTPNAADKVNAGAAGAAYTIVQGQTVEMVTDGAGNWWPMFQTTPTGTYTPKTVTTSQTLGAGTYSVNTSAGPITLTLPSGSSVGTTLEFTDLPGTWGKYPMTLARNGNTIVGSASDLVCNISGETFKIWFDGSDWKLF